MALAETPLISQHGIRLGDALAAVLERRHDMIFVVVDNCVVNYPIRNRPSYLNQSIQLFKTERSDLDFVSYQLYQALVAAELKKTDPRNIGTVSTIGSNSDSPQVGPVNVEHKTLQTLLNKLALEAGSTMWIAFPKTDNEAWLFIPYSRSAFLVRSQLNGIIQMLPNYRY